VASLDLPVRNAEVGTIHVSAGVNQASRYGFMTVIRGGHKRGPAMRGCLIYVYTPKQPLDYLDLAICRG